MFGVVVVVGVLCRYLEAYQVESEMKRRGVASFPLRIAIRGHPSLRK